VAFTKVLLIYQIYYTWIHPLHHSPLSPPPPIPGTVSTGLIFPYTHMCTQYLHHIHPLTLSPPHLIPTKKSLRKSGFVEVNLRRINHPCTSLSHSEQYRGFIFHWWVGEKQKMNQENNSQNQYKTMTMDGPPLVPHTFFPGDSNLWMASGQMVTNTENTGNWQKWSTDSPTWKSVKFS
jgi:hypothetical protein